MTATRWNGVHNGLMCLWEIGIHRLINANAANINEWIVPEKYGRELGIVLATNLLRGIPVVDGRRFKVPFNNKVIRCTAIVNPASERVTIGGLCESIFRAELMQFSRSPLSRTFCNHHRKCKRCQVVSKLVWKSVHDPEAEVEVEEDTMASSQEEDSDGETSDNTQDTEDTEDYDPAEDDTQIGRGTDNRVVVCDPASLDLGPLLQGNRSAAATTRVITPEEEWDSELVEVTPPRAPEPLTKVLGARGTLRMSVPRLSSLQLTRMLAAATTLSLPSSPSPKSRGRTEIETGDDSMVITKSRNPHKVREEDIVRIDTSDEEDNQRTLATQPKRAEAGSAVVRQT